ncbi:MAG: DUF58 domain-containing protein [Eubacteriales bacterium]|nr:DUF58 domain-containing protein [Eubacteriales bacterium]
MAKFKGGFWAMPLFAGIALVYAAWMHDQLLWFLFYLSVGCVALTLLYRWRQWTAVEITRSFNTDKTILEAGSNLLVSLRAEVFSLLPWPWLEIWDTLPQGLERHIDREPRGNLAWARKGAIQYTTYWVPKIPRGIHKWDALQYMSGDPLGFVAYQGRIRKPAQLVVYPRTIELPALKFFPRRVEGSVMTRKTFNQSQTQLAGIREYQPGDRLSLIDWKSTAKTGHLQSKEFEPLLMSFSLVVLDCSIDAWSRGFDPAFEEAVTVAASLVKAAVAAHIPTRFHSNYTRQRGQQSVTSPADYYNLLGHLAAIASDGRDIMTQLLYQEMFIRDNNVVVVSSHRGTRLQKVLRHLSVRGNSVTLVLVNGKSETEPSIPPRREGFFTEIFIDKAEDLIPAARAKEVN